MNLNLSLNLVRAMELGSMVEEVLSEEAEPRHLSQLQTAIDNLQNSRWAQGSHWPLECTPCWHLPSLSEDFDLLEPSLAFQLSPPDIYIQLRCNFL